MDWTLYHWADGLLAGHGSLAEELKDFSVWSVPALAVATLALWLAGRPGVISGWKRATASALASAGIALAVNQVIGHIWSRDRPTAAHPGQAHLYFVPPSTDPSFPSDHAAAAFAIAFAVFFLSRRAGIGFLVAATGIALDRVLLGLHYPGDVAAGLLVGLGSAAFVHFVCRRPILWLVAVASRVTDPLVRPVWRRLDGARARS